MSVLDEKSENSLRIMTKAHELFMERGFSKVTMDELATELGMSKKSLYVDFKGKDDLLVSIFEHLKENLSTTFEQILQNQDLSFTQKFINIMSIISEKISTIRPRFMDDLKRYRPEIWQNITEFRKQHIHKFMSELIDEGKVKGYVKEDIPTEIIVNVYESSIQRMIHPDFLMHVPYQAKDVFKHILTILFTGVIKPDKKEEFKSIIQLEEQEASLS